MALSKEEIKKLAILARINLTPEEEDRYAETISAVLEYMKILNEINTAEVEPTFQVTGLENIVREDMAIESKNREKLLKQMPKFESEELVVPGVFE
jgi:aspartyl-tRNA(Asn)/glutamyl-tRNA(Gln) amidotransferase subunit C